MYYTILTKGCSCKKGCVSNNCGCRNSSKHCGPGCECQGCVNLPIKDATPNNCAVETSDEETDEEENESNHLTEETDIEIITEDFFIDNIDII